MRTSQGEWLNFESPAELFGQLTKLCWNLVREILGAGRVGVRALARRLDRDVRRVHQDAYVLIDLGILEQDEDGALSYPFADIHTDMHLTRDMRKAA